MLRKRTGFTLIELLIAAAIIGVLAMFATQAFRASASDVRISDAKARALLLVNAAEQYFIEHPGATSFKIGSEDAPLLGFAPPDTCSTGSNSAQQLVNCGFLEYRQVQDNNVDMWFNAAGPTSVKVCFKGKGRVTDTCTYCTSGGDFDKDCEQPL